MADLLISAVSAGSQGAFGTQSLANAAQGIFAAAIDALRVGNTIVGENLPARSLASDFTQAVDSPPATTVRFTFRGAQVQSATTASDQSAFGKAAIANAARGAFVEGVPSPPFLSVPIVHRASSSMPMVLDIAAFRLAYPAINVPFPFGGTQLVSNASAGVQTAFGEIEDIKQPIAARPPGISPGSIGLPIITDASRNGSYVPLNLTGSAGGIGKSVRFDFGAGALPITQISASLSSRLGKPAVANVAQGAFAQSFETLGFGFARTYMPFVRDGAINLELAQGISIWPALNVPFYFNEAIGFGPLGFNAAVFGTTKIYNVAQGAFVEGIPPHGFGTAHVQIPRFVRPTGIAPGTFGSTAISRPAFSEIRPGSIVQFGMGSPSIRLQYRTIRPSGFAAGTVGGAYQVSWRRFITPIGYVATRYGTQKLENLNRALAAAGSNMTGYGTATRVTHRLRELRPSGGAPWAFGTARVTLRVRFISPFGFTVGAVGQSTSIYNYDPTQYITVPGNDVGLIAADVHVENWIRHLAPTGIESSTRFGNFTTVENRNKTIAPSGTPFGRYGQPSVGETRYPRTLLPPTILPRGVGEPSLRLAVRYIEPPGWYSTGFSNFNAVAIDESNILKPGGIARPEIQLGTPLVKYGQFFGYPSGVAPRGVGTPTVWFRIRPIRAEGIFGASFGIPRFEHDLRFITVPTLGTGGFGPAKIELKKRYIVTIGSVTVRFGTSLIGYSIIVNPPGIEAPLFGQAWVHDNSQTINLATRGIAAGALGQLGKIEFYTRFVQQSTTPDQAVFGAARLYNLRQYVAPFTDTPLIWGPYFGNFLYVYNRNRTIQPYGFNAAKVSIGSVVYNDARVVAPSGPNTFATGPGTFIADRVRYLLPPGVERGLSLRWHIVTNSARVIRYEGRVQSLFGLALVENRRRTVKHHTGYVGPEWGTAYSDFAIRTLSFYQGIPPLPFGFATVQNSAQDIRPVAFKWPDETGGHDVEEHFTIIGPVRTVVQTKYGEPVVRNKTPQLYAYGHDSQAYGNTKIRLQYRSITNAGGGSTMDLWGRPLVRDRRTRVSVSGFTSTRIGLQRVRLGNPDLPWPQTIEAAGFPPFNGATFRALMGTPDVWANSLFPEGIRVAVFGMPSVYLQGIRPESVIPAENFALQFGIPLVNPWFEITTDGIAPVMPSRMDRGTDWGGGPNKHRMDPLTIWCRFDAGEQALANHNRRSWEYMDHRFNPTGDSGQRPLFGSLVVTHRNRRITQRDSSFFGRLGMPTVDLRKRYVQPSGFKPFRYGIAELFGGSRSFQFYGFEMGGLGAPTVAHYTPPFTTQFVSPFGYLAYATGANRIELWIRTVLPIGAAPVNGGRPEVSRSPRFLEHEGYSATQFGMTWISLYRRYVEPIGSDTAEVSYTIGSFSLRMRVRHRDRYAISAGWLGTFGTPAVASSVQRISQTDEIRHGELGSPACSTRSIVALGGHGLDAGAFGDVDRWEAGKIKAHGDDMLRCGLPRTQRGINTFGDEGGNGIPRIAQPIAPAGFDSAIVGDPATPLLNPHGCGQTARVIVPWVFVLPIVGTPVVA